MFKNPGKLKLILLIIAAIFLIVFVASYFFLIPLILNSDKYKLQIRDSVQKTIEHPVRIGDMSYSTTLGFGLKVNFKSFKIFHKNGTDFVSAGPVSVEISLPALMQKEILVKRVILSNSVATITRDKNRRIDLQDLIPEEKKVRKYKVIFRNSDFILDNYKIRFIDNFVFPGQSYFISGKNIKINDFDPDKHIEVNAVGNIEAKNRPNTDFDLAYSSNLPLNKDFKRNDISLRGRVKNLYPIMFQAYLKKYASAYFSSLSGTVDTKFKIDTKNSKDYPMDFDIDALLKDFKAVKTNDPARYDFAGKTRIIARGTKTTKDLTLQEISINSKKLRADLNGNIIGVNTKKTNLDLKLNIKNSSLLTIIYMVPKEIYVPNNLISKLRKYNTQANLWTNLNIKGNLQTPDLFGDLTLKDISMVSNVQTIPDGNGRIDFRGKNYNLNFKLFIAQAQLVNITGSVAPFQDKLNLKINSNILDLGRVHMVILALRDIINFQLGIFGNIAAEGRGKTDFDITGTSTNPFFKGFVELISAKVNYKGLSQPLQNVKGRLYFSGDKVYFDNVKGKIAKSFLTAKGWIDSSNINLTLWSNKLNLSAARSFIRNSPILVDVEKIISEFTSMSGYAGMTLNLEGNLKKGDIFNNLKIVAFDSSITPRELGFPVKLRKGKILVTSEGVYTSGIQSEIMGTRAKIAGKITGFGANITPDLNIVIQKFEFDKIETIASSPIIPQDIRDIISKFQCFGGTFNANVDILPSGYEAVVRFNNLFAMYTPECLPINLTSGMINIKPGTVSFNELTGKIATSPFFVNGTLKNFETSPDVGIIASAEINSKDIEEFVNPHLDEPIKAEGIFPIKIAAGGNLNNWKISSQVLLNKGNYVHIRHDIGLPLDKIRLVDIKAHGSLDKIVLQNLDVLTAESIAEADITPFFPSHKTAPASSCRCPHGFIVKEFSPALPDGFRASGTSPVFTVSGTIDGLRSEKPYLSGFTITIPNPLSVKILNPALPSEANEPFFSDGFVTGEILISGPVASPEITGSAELKNITVPSREITLNQALIDVTPDVIVLKNSDLKIADSQMQITAEAEKNFSLPVMIKKMNVNASTFNLGEITDAFKSTSDEDTGTSSAEEEAVEDLPVVIRNGLLNADELILNNLITTNFSTNFTLNENGLLNMPNIVFESAEGKTNGNIKYNFKTTELSGKMSAKGMSANAAATAFLNVPNEVYGKLNADFQFRTKGTEQEEFFSNAEGSVNFKITDGRLVRLGSVEYLLLTANTVFGGVANININKILNLVIPQKTGYFDELNGKVTAKNGVLSTDGIRSKGKNLSLLLKGKLEMATHNADLTIFGRLSRRVAGKLGPLGNLSVNTLVDYLPGIGFLPGSTERGRGLLQSIPLLNRIPLLGLGNRYRLFVVKIVGDLYDPNSVQGFRWLNK